MKKTCFIVALAVGLFVCTGHEALAVIPDSSLVAYADAEEDSAKSNKKSGKKSKAHKHSQFRRKT